MNKNKKMLATDESNCLGRKKPLANLKRKYIYICMDCT